MSDIRIWRKVLPCTTCLVTRTAFVVFRSILKIQELIFLFLSEYIRLCCDVTLMKYSHGHVKENIWQGIPQGWLARDHQSWFNSNQRLLLMEKTMKAKIIPGHDEDIATPLFGQVLT